MRRLFLAATVGFWLALAAAWWWRSAEPARDATVAQRIVGAAELARHASGADCWMAIRGAVYDLTRYLPDHPSEPEIIEPWCGREATRAYETKLRGRPHSARADEMLERLRIGIAASAPLPGRP